MVSNKFVNIIRYLLIPIPLSLYFVYYCYTNGGPLIMNYIVGFIFFVIISVSVIFNIYFFKIKRTVRFTPQTPTVKNGIPCKVKIISVNYTNRRVNKYPVYDLLLDVVMEGKPVYQISRTQPGTPIILTKLIIGKEYPGMIAAEDKMIVQIDELDKFY